MAKVLIVTTAALLLAISEQSFAAKRMSDTNAVRNRILARPDLGVQWSVHTAGTRICIAATTRMPLE